ncbi:MAG TPA: hemerythrin domain-containing protein [Terriglobales bacterium]|nr:hemerythrin domain-containing protein [Terriglobales bacterium]
MLRDKSLVVLSHQHQHALALCVEIQQSTMAPGSSTGSSIASWQDRIQYAFESEIELHFQAEERVLFPAAHKHDQLRLLISELIAEHTMLRSYRYAAMAFSMTSRDILEFAAALSLHIRKEEQQLFQGVQRVMDADELTSLGGALHEFFDRHARPEIEKSTSIGNCS